MHALLARAFPENRVGATPADGGELFVSACERVGVASRHNGERVRVNRRASVALMLAHVGLKT